MAEPFRVGLTRDFLKPDGTFGFGDIGLDLLDQVPGLEWEMLPDHAPELPAEWVAPYDALLMLGGRLTPRTLEGADRLLLVARFGVGYDNVDVSACTEHGVILTITPDGVRRPVASSIVASVLATAHRLFEKDRLTREGRWFDRLDHTGFGLAGRTLGLIGLGNIGREVCRLIAPFEMRILAFDPYAAPERAAEAGATLVELETLLAESDFVAISCALTPETHHLLDAARIARMKPSAFLINLARGPIVDQAALTQTLRERHILGAVLDVFEKEPIDADDPLLALDNVILAPHAMCWTDECFRGIGSSACRSIVEVAGGRVPAHVVNRDVLEHPRLREALARRAG